MSDDDDVTGISWALLASSFVTMSLGTLIIAIQLARAAYSLFGWTGVGLTLTLIAVIQFWFHISIESDPEPRLNGTRYP
jgi:hypothetical protein